MEKGITVKIPSACSEIEGLSKYGELSLKIMAQPYNKNKIGYIDILSVDEPLTVTLDESAYFCKGATDSTPINDSIETSRELTSTELNLFIKFNAEAILKINNKYKILGIFNNKSYYDRYVKVITDNSDIFKYCNNMIGFPQIVGTKINHKNIKSKVINSGISLTSGDYSGFTFGSTTYQYSGGDINIQGVSGNIKIGGSYNTLILQGDFNCDISHLGILNHLISPNINVDLSIITPAYNWITIEKIQFGDIDNICNVTFGTSSVFKGAKSYIKIYSNNFNLDSLKRLVSVQLNRSFLQDFSLVIFSTILNENDVKADSNLHNQLLQLSSRTTGIVQINNYIVPKS